ncbi:MAG: PAS domain S-box protein [Gammaproteobacteria bacterium]|nr:PAS domain S-box protein [Gammaproteobacteria bacterium]
MFLGENPVFTAYLRDITERKAIEERLRSSEALRRAVTDSVPDWLLLLGVDLRVQFANRAVLGITPEMMVGRPVLQFVPEAERANAQAVFARVTATRSPQVYEYRDCMGGEVRWFENRVGPVIEGGQVVGLTVASSEITARRRSEDALRTQARILDTMREGVLVLDSRRMIRVVNAALGRLTGYQPLELIGRPGRMLSPRSESEYAPVDAQILRTLRSEGYREFEFECVRRDGTSFMAAGVLTPIDIGGEEHILAVLEDITQRRVLEREIIEIANREQRRIGSDLHDGLGQELTGIALMLRGLTGRLHKEAVAAAGDAEEIVQLVNRAIESTRSWRAGFLRSVSSAAACPSPCAPWRRVPPKCTAAACASAARSGRSSRSMRPPAITCTGSPRKPSPTRCATARRQR